VDITDTSILADVTPEALLEWRFRRVGACALPVFVHRDDEYAVFYAPRVACVVPAGLAVAVEHQLEHAAAAVDAAAGRCGSAVERASASLVETARGAVGEAAQARAGGFQPECLTLFVNDFCNLTCGYCHAQPGGGSVRAISLEVVRAAGEEVAAACARRGLVFTCVVHGGGEPTQDPSRVDAVLGVLEAVARNHGVRLWTYIATNGVMPEERARWVAARFDLVGLSCDGPPDVQERQRPARDGLPTSPRVERTARILRDAGRPFHARATITQGTIERQPEIAAYLVDRLAPGEVRLEPVYDGAAAGGPGAPPAPPGGARGV
jgi:sulfatase maturation enzyme AslB (radical SAM superfamily)